MTPEPKPKKSRRSTPAEPGDPARVRFPPPLPLPRSEKTHPAIGLGLWALGRWSLEDEAKTKATIGRALERGLRWFDTAEVYGSGRSERLLGDVLARTQSLTPPLFLATKVSWEHLRPAQVRAALVGSLQRLNRTSADLYLVHAPDPHVPVAETMGTMEALWKEQRIGAVGVSNFSVAQMEEAEAALSEAPLSVNQVRFSLLDRREGNEILAHCRAKGVVVEAYSPLARGLLTGRYLDGKRPPAEVRRFTEGVLEGNRLEPVLRAARELRSLAQEEEVPMASLALYWLIRQGVAPVFGASVPGQVDEIVDALAHRPSDAALDQADRLTLGALD